MDADPIPLSSLCVIPTGDEERERTRKKRAGRQTGKQEEHSFIVRVRTPEREEGRNEEEIALMCGCLPLKATIKCNKVSIIQVVFGSYFLQMY